MYFLLFKNAAVYLGQKDVTVAFTPNGYADAPVGDQFVLPDERGMNFGTFLDILEKNRGEKVAYIQKQNSSFLDEFEELIPDAGLYLEASRSCFR